MKKDKGITLIALVVTIVIILILAGVTLNLALGDGGLISISKESAKQYKDAQEKESGDLSEMKDLLQSINHETFNKKGVNRPVLTDGMIPIKYKNGKWVITNENDEEWYEYLDVNNLAWANVMLSDGKYKWSARNDKNASGYYTDDGTTVVNDADLGSMFVWIPRFAYSITKYHTESNNGEGTTQKIFNITFINGTGNTDYDGTTYLTTYSLDEMDKKIGQATPKIVHPAFKNSKGIWIAKFEASMKGTNPNTNANDKVDASILRILPNVNTWRYISIGNSFLNCFNMQKSDNVFGLIDSKVDSHMTMNTEWGAVAYLAASQYGYVPTINNSNEAGSETNVYSEFSGGKDYRTNVSQSTTNNVTGVYDMCGGAWEYVAAYYDNKNANLNTYGKDVFNNDKTVKNEYKEYWDVYNVGEDEKTEYVEIADLWNKDKSYNSERMRITKERYEKMKEHLGDAMYEIINPNGYLYYGKDTNNKNSWLILQNGNTNSGCGYYNNDYALIGNCALTFIYRGGYWNNVNNTGVFALLDSGGDKRWDSGFRPVLVCQ